MAQYNITPDRLSALPTPPRSGSPSSCAASTAGCAPGSASPRSLPTSSRSRRRSSRTIAGNRVLYWGLMIAQLGIVFFLSARVEKIAAGTASLLFVLYSALTGVTFAFILLAFTGESIATTFMISAGMFGALALYGTTTSRSLAGWGQFLFMGLIGVVLASFVGIFWQNAGFQFVLGFIGVIVFTGLTAYDAQRLKQMALALPSRPDRVLRHRRRADALSRLHQPVPDAPALHRQPAGNSRQKV